MRPAAVPATSVPLLKASVTCVCVCVCVCVIDKKVETITIVLNIHHMLVSSRVILVEVIRRLYQLKKSRRILQ